MPSFEQPVVDNQTIITVGVSKSGEQRYTFKALVDTGAQTTTISPRAIEALGLVPTGLISLTVASGTSISTHKYRARVDIPIGYNAFDVGGSRDFFYGDELTVCGLPRNPHGYDVLLGMDLIGIFHITIYRNRIILSN